MAEKKKQPTVFILYIPGGAMLGIIPALTLARLESLTETPAAKLFQVFEGVSTGALLAAGLNMPGMTGRKVAELFVRLGPRFFPEMPGRWAKMHARNGINIAKIFYNLDPKRSDFLVIRNIEKLCSNMRQKCDPALVPDINRLEQEATRRWLTASDIKNLLLLCQQMAEKDPQLGRSAQAVAELLATRPAKNRLAIIFRRVAVKALDGLKDKWAQKDHCLYDPAIPESHYRKIFGDMKISDAAHSTYISAYDILNNKVVTFSALHKNLFNSAAGTATVKNDIKIWDAVMASTANPFAFPPHITETNLLCSDKAMIHKPRSVKDVLAAVAPGTRVVLVILGTGRHLSKELVEFMDRNDDPETASLTREQRYRRHLEAMRDDLVELGVAGNLAIGRELAELEGYASSDALEDFREKLGAENVIEITPRLAPHTLQEKAEFPAKDMLDASRENVKKIIRRARLLMREEDTAIRTLAQMLVDNLYILGEIDGIKHTQLCKKIGIKACEGEACQETAGMERHIASNDNSTGLRRLWRRVRRQIVMAAPESPLPSAAGGPRRAP